MGLRALVPLYDRRVYLPRLVIIRGLICVLDASILECSYESITVTILLTVAKSSRVTGVSTAL